MFKLNLTNLLSVDSILQDFHSKVHDLESLIEVRTQRLAKAEQAIQKAVWDKLDHNAEIQKAQAAIDKIKEFLQ